MKVLVIGGTLFIGRQLVSELLKAGHSVAILHRKNKHNLSKRVENLAADRNDPAAVRRVLAGRRFEVVFDNVYDWERGTSRKRCRRRPRTTFTTGSAAPRPSMWKPPPTPRAITSSATFSCRAWRRT